MRMIDVGGKPVSKRQAVAVGWILMKPETLKLVKTGKLPKGDVLAAARVAAFGAAKQTPFLIPLCHPLLIEHVAADIEIKDDPAAVILAVSVKGAGKTGYEMEALTAVSVGLLTIYDMCKMLDTTLRIEGIRLLKKSGGKSGTVNYK